MLSIEQLKKIGFKEFSNEEIVKIKKYLRIERVIELIYSIKAVTPKEDEVTNKALEYLLCLVKSDVDSI